MKKSTIIFQFSALFMAALLMLSSCIKDPKDEILNTLEGEWEVTSWLIEYGVLGQYVEIYPDLLISASTIKFKEYENGEGNFDLQYTEPYGTVILQGEYECNQAGDEVKITFDDTDYGERVPIKISLNGDHLILTGLLLNANSIVSAKRQ